MKTKMTNQQALKKLAEAQGYEAEIISTRRINFWQAHPDERAKCKEYVLCKSRINTIGFEYDPATNPAQAQELQMHYKMSVSAIDSPHTTFCRAYSKNSQGEGATPSEAITACAIEIIKEE